MLAPRLRPGTRTSPTGPPPPMGAIRPEGAFAPEAGWSRQRLLAVLAGVVGAALLLLAGLGYAAYLTISGDTARQQSPDNTPAYIRGIPAPRTGQGHGRTHRDAIAAAPMLRVDPDAMNPTAPAATVAPDLTVPSATALGPADVPSRFPHTPAGAVGQLAAIEATVLSQMSIAATSRIHRAWALPGAADVAAWPLTKDVQAFLTASDSGPTMDATTTVVATPAGAMVKGTDGPDWTLACVLLQISATIETDAQIGYGYCEAMAWARSSEGGRPSGRWMIAPGHPAATAPSTWPGSTLAIRAGWRTWADQAGRTGRTR